MKLPKAHWHAAASARSEASRVLRQSLDYFFACGDEVAKAGVSAKKLHDFRLLAKRMRYTMELFEPLFGAALRPQLEGLRGVQQALGQLTDCETSLELLDEVGGLTPEWRHAIETRMDKKRGEFQSLWQDQFTDPALREAWRDALPEPN